MRISDWSSDVCSSDLENITIVALKGDRRVNDRVYLRSYAFNYCGVDARVIARNAVVVISMEMHDRCARASAAYTLRDEIVDPDRNQGLAFPAPRSEEHTSELQSLMRISYAVFCLKKKNKTNKHTATQYIQHNQTQTANQ